ncbi:MAG: HEAT repeat domain-containing protein [Candidatus Thorarchaeota archaeon]|jgi:hypothetical protein
MIESKLSRLVRLRRYEDIESLVSSMMKNGGWSDIVEKFRELKPPEYTLEKRSQSNKSIAKAIARGDRVYMSFQSFRENPQFLKDPNSIWGVREGKVRDALIRLLGFEAIDGIDCDLLNEFGSIKAKTIKTLRNKALPKAKAILKEQVKYGNTFFFDVERLATEPYAVLVPDIIEIREREILDLPKNATQNQIATTYYGFTIYTQGGRSEMVRSKTGGTIYSFFKSLGSESILSSSRLVYKEARFRNCTEYKQKLLLAMLKISLGGKTNAREACNTLGLLGDSRAVNLICDILTKREPRNGIKHLLRALCQIGDPRALETIMSQTNVKSAIEERFLIQSLGGIRTSKTVKILSEVLKMNKQHWTRGGRDRTKRKLEAVKALGYTHDEQAIELLSEALYHRSYKIATEAFRSLMVHSKAGQLAAKENADRLGRLLRRDVDIKITVLGIMKGFPELFDVPVISKEIAQLLTSPFFSSRIIPILKEHPPVVFEKEWKDACLEAMMKTSHPLKLHMEIDHLIGIEKYGPLYMEIIKQQVSAIINEIHPGITRWDSLEPVFNIDFLRENKKIQEKMGALCGVTRHHTERVEWDEHYRWLATVPEFVDNDRAKSAIIDRIKEGKRAVIKGVCQIPKLRSNVDITKCIMEQAKTNWGVAIYLKETPELYNSPELLDSLLYYLRETVRDLFLGSHEVSRMIRQVPELMENEIIQGELKRMIRQVPELMRNGIISRLGITI